MTTQVSAEPEAQAKISYEEFLERTHDSPHVEWVAGEIVPMSPISDRDANLTDFLNPLLRHFVEAHHLGVIREQAEFYQLGADGIYRPAELGSQGRYQSVVLPGLWLQVSWL